MTYHGSAPPCPCVEADPGTTCKWAGKKLYNTYGLVKARAVAKGPGPAPWAGRSITASCCCARRAPQQPGSTRQHGAVLLCRAAAARAQQPGANARFGFWALLGPVWPRRAPRGSRAPSNCMSTQGRGSKQGPVCLSPAPLRPWPGPAAARAQQPGANARFSFWALFGPVWPRGAPQISGVD
jgi:hypothetical protein